MAIIIPWPDAPAWQQSVVLSGRAYRLAARWNEVADAWFLDIYDAQGVPLALGLKMVTGAMILARLADPRLPPGYLTVLSDQDVPDRQNMPTQARLAYVAV